MFYNPFAIQSQNIFGYPMQTPNISTRAFDTTFNMPQNPFSWGPTPMSPFMSQFGGYPGYSLPQMGNQPNPGFKYGNTPNPLVGDVLNPNLPTPPQPAAPVAPPQPTNRYFPNYEKAANAMGASEIGAGISPFALQAMHQRLGGDQDAWRKTFAFNANPILSKLIGG